MSCARQVAVRLEGSLSGAFAAGEVASALAGRPVEPLAVLASRGTNFCPSLRSAAHARVDRLVPSRCGVCVSRLAPAALACWPLIALRRRRGGLSMVAR